MVTLLSVTDHTELRLSDQYIVKEQARFLDRLSEN